MEALIFVALVALLGYGLQRNHDRQSQVRSGLAGSTDIQDRDAERLLDELRAVHC